MITKHIPVKRIIWKITLRIHIFSIISYNRTRYYFESTIPISDSFLYVNPFLNTQYFKLFIRWNINGWNFENRVRLNSF